MAALKKKSGEKLAHKDSFLRATHMFEANSNIIKPIVVER